MLFWLHFLFAWHFVAQNALIDNHHMIQQQPVQHHSIHHVVSSRSARCVWKKIGVWWISLLAVGKRESSDLTKFQPRVSVVHDGLIKRFHSAEQRKSHNKVVNYRRAEWLQSCCREDSGETGGGKLVSRPSAIFTLRRSVSIQLAVIARSFDQSDVFGFGSW